MESTITNQLTSQEQGLFENCEVVIRDGLNTFFAVGKALMAIRDDRLYRQTYETFGDYCNVKWKLSKSRCYQLIESAVVANVVSTNGGHKIENERQARELSRLPADQQAEAWQETVEKTDGKPTASKVREVVDERMAVETKAVKVCPNCGGNEFDEDGDCAACYEPAEPGTYEKIVAKLQAKPEDPNPVCEAWDAIEAVIDKNTKGAAHFHRLLIADFLEEKAKQLRG